MLDPIIHIQTDLASLKNIVTQRLEKYFKPELAVKNDPIPFNFLCFDDLLLSDDEKLILLIVLSPHIQPAFYDNIIQQYLPQGGEFVEFGGIRGSSYRGLLPTGETIQFILAGNDINKRLEIQQLLLGESKLIEQTILTIEHVKDGEPLMSGRMILNEEFVVQRLTGKQTGIKFSPDFPAKLLETKMTWEDLVLSSTTLRQIEDIKTWLYYNQQLIQQEWNLARKIKPGYRSLFYGPPGTGKTLTASLLGKQFDRDVYRIDLSQVVSKYIGETEKNLEKVFQKAENKNWILFFDEADSLFGKRSSVQSAHDKFANQETSYLLQRVEDFNGLIILASNFKNNIDSAFLRRFNSIIHFPQPTLEERKMLWKKALPENMETDFNIGELAAKYELTGAAIINVVYFAALRALSEKSGCLKLNHVLEGIKNEFHKEDKFF